MNVMKEVDIGTRKLQKGAGGHVLNVPAIVTRALDLHPGDAVRWKITNDGALRIEKEHAVLPDMNLAGLDQAALQHTPTGGMAANES
jgi:antitoxin component of MazEF toxin-antitoxin module